MPHINGAARGNLTQSQFLVWMGQKLNADAPLYNMIVTFEFEGELDAPAFCAAFQQVVAGTDVLRTVIVEQDGVPNQQVLPAIPFDMPCIDFSQQAEPPQAAREWMDRQRLCMFDLSRRLFDSVLLKLSDTRHIWYLSQHHLITDGWSVRVVYKRQAEMLAALVQDGNEAARRAMAAWPQFDAYAAHESALRNTPALEKALSFWDARASVASEPLEFFGRTNPQRSARTERVACSLGRERTMALRAIAREKGFATLSADLSLYNIYATLMASFVRRETGAGDIRVGVPFHNRMSPAFKDTAGMFIEIGPLQVRVQDDDTFNALHRKAAGDMLLAMRHATPGISTAQQNHVYEVLLNFVNVTFPTLGGMQPKVEWVHAGYGDRNHALRLQIHDFGSTGSDQLLFDFNTDVFDESQRASAVQHFLRVTDAFIADRNRRIDRIGLQTEAERHALVREFNQTDAPYPSGETVVDLFEARAAAQPDAVAVEHAGATLTYRELSRRANQIAHHLRLKGVQAGSIAVIRMAHGLETIAAILGVLKAGCAYAPIDPAYPVERLQFMLDDIAAAGRHVFLITQPALNDAASSAGLLLDSTFARVNDVQDTAINLSAPDGLAYVIYTSGSTGQPKGVMICHRSLTNYIHWAGGQYTDGERLTWALFTSMSFDLTVTTVFTPLITGGRIIAYHDDAHAPGSAILKIMAENRCDVVKLTPSHLTMIHEMDLRLSRIRRFIVGGEDFKTALALGITRAFGKPVELCNEYGPTEATVGCMLHRFDAQQDRGLSVPVGVPAANANLFVLDAHLNPVPAGTTGEMHIAGDGLALGYLNRADLTRERFITVEDARLNESGQPLRLYKTGDLARWDAQGRLEFLGRADQQVKIAGVRMELGEIEARLMSHPSVRDCVVVLAKPAQAETQHAQHCARCGLESSYPETSFDAAGVCNFCRAFEHYKDRAMAYFKTMDAFAEIVEQMKSARRGAYDCVVLFSGGKDSTYMLYQLAGMGLTPLAFTLDNGFISDEAKANIRRVVTALGIDHVYGQTPAMNAIFADSLKRHANVCNGCFKTIYSLATQLARERSISYIVTGLSRGQFFETRLSADVFSAPGFDAGAIDEAIHAARKAYHKRDDLVSRSLDVDLFRDDALFNDVHFVDFYRYCTVSLDELYGFLNAHAPWIRPSDTGRSTNCLINEAGIYVHKKLRGFHNYALPYSWDVRLGHKNRADALEELDDEIDEARVKRILSEIGYDDARLREAPAEKLVAYVVTDAPLPATEMQAYLAQFLPASAIPALFVQLAQVPLTPNGKVDRKALPAPGAQRPDMSSAYVAPRNAKEQLLADIWAKALRVARVGIHDNFFELSGDSIISIQITAKANQAGLKLAPNQLFMRPTIAELAEVATNSEAQHASPAIGQGRVSDEELNSVFAEFAE